MCHTITNNPTFPRNSSSNRLMWPLEISSINHPSALHCASASKVQVSEGGRLPVDRKNRTSSVQVRFRSGGGNSRRGMDGRIHAETVQDPCGQLNAPFTLLAILISHCVRLCHLKLSYITLLSPLTCFTSYDLTSGSILLHYFSLRYLHLHSGGGKSGHTPSKLAMEFGPLRGRKSNGSIVILCTSKDFGLPVLMSATDLAFPLRKNTTENMKKGHQKFWQIDEIFGGNAEIFSKNA